MFSHLDQARLLALVQEQAGPAPIIAMSYEEVGADLSSQAADSARGLGFADSLWDRLKAEFRDLVCGSSQKYADLRARFHSLETEGTAAVVAVVSTTLATMIG